MDENQKSPQTNQQQSPSTVAHANQQSQQPANPPQQPPPISQAPQQQPPQQPTPQAPPAPQSVTQIQSPAQGEPPGKGKKILKYLVIFLLGIPILGIILTALLSAINPSGPSSQPTQSSLQSESKEQTGQGGYGEEVFYPDGGELPLSSAFVGEMITKQRALTPSQGYGNVVNAIGQPTYNFSVLYDLSWKQTQYTTGQWGMSGEGVELGMVFVEGKPTVPAPCEKSIQIAHGLASAEMRVTVESSERTTLNGKDWDRVMYQVQNTETSETRKGITQCLQTDVAFLVHHLLSSPELWAQKSEEFMKIMDDVYIHRVATK